MGVSDYACIIYGDHQNIATPNDSGFYYDSDGEEVEYDPYDEVVDDENEDLYEGNENYDYGPIMLDVIIFDKKERVTHGNLTQKIKEKSYLRREFMSPDGYNWDSWCFVPEIGYNAYRSIVNSHENTSTWKAGCEGSDIRHGTTNWAFFEADPKKHQVWVRNICPRAYTNFVANDKLLPRISNRELLHVAEAMRNAHDNYGVEGVDTEIYHNIEGMTRLDAYNLIRQEIRDLYDL